MDDREGAISMSILLDRAEMDLGTALREYECSMSSKLRFDPSAPASW